MDIIDVEITDLGLFDTIPAPPGAEIMTNTESFVVERAHSFAPDNATPSAPMHFTLETGRTEYNPPNATANLPPNLPPPIPSRAACAPCGTDGARKRSAVVNGVVAMLAFGAVGNSMQKTYFSNGRPD